MRLNVFTEIKKGETHLIGTLDARPGDGEFIYNPEWIRNPDAWPVDPINLTLTEGVFKTNRASGLFSAFEDSLPDDWGRRILVQKHRLRGQTPPVELLKHLGADTMGALMYSEKEIAPTSTNLNHNSLERLLNDSIIFAENPSAQNLSALFEAGSSPGGARPKAIFVDNNHNQFIAKFPSHNDTFDVALWEAASLSLARCCGLNTSDHQIIRVNRKNILLVARFDRREQGRRHMLSFQTLLGKEGYYYASYGDLKDIVAKYAENVKKETLQLFRQMVFNAAIGNTDDHLKNFTAFINKQGTLELTPAYDLLPNIQGRKDHVLNFHFDPWTPNKNTLQKIGRSWGIHNPNAVANQILDVFDQEWKNTCDQYGISKREWQRLNPDGELRRKEMRS
jgi:serine/threonine-protein kinase HipA